MALFLLENRDFLGFRMIFKVPLNQIVSNFNAMLYTIKYRLTLIMVYFTFTVHISSEFTHLHDGLIDWYLMPTLAVFISAVSWYLIFIQ